MLEYTINVMTGCDFISTITNTEEYGQYTVLGYVILVSDLCFHLCAIQDFLSHLTYHMQTVKH